MQDQGHTESAPLLLILKLRVCKLSWLAHVLIRRGAMVRTIRPQFLVGG